MSDLAINFIRDRFIREHNKAQKYLRRYRMAVTTGYEKIEILIQVASSKILDFDIRHNKGQVKISCGATYYSQFLSIKDWFKYKRFPAI